MTKFARMLVDSIKDSRLSRMAYANEWDVSQRTLRHWLEDTSPGAKHMAKILERFPNLTSDDFKEIAPVATNGHWDKNMTKIILAKMKVVDLTFLFEWLALQASSEERKKFREELGPEWERFINLARALINEKSLEVAQAEGRLNSQRRSV